MIRENINWWNKEIMKNLGTLDTREDKELVHLLLCERFWTMSLKVYNHYLRQSHGPKPGSLHLSQRSPIFIIFMDWCNSLVWSPLASNPFIFFQVLFCSCFFTLLFVKLICSHKWLLLTQNEFCIYVSFIIPVVRSHWFLWNCISYN